MQATGIVRRIDPLGRIVLPKELRDTRNLQEGTPLEIFIDGKDIVLRRYEPQDEKKLKARIGLEEVLKNIKEPKYKEAIIQAIDQLK